MTDRNTARFLQRKLNVIYRALKKFSVTTTCLMLASQSVLAQDVVPRFKSEANSVALSRESLTELEREFVKENPVLRVAVSREGFPPYQVVEEDVVSGHSVQILQSVAEAIGFKLELKMYDTWLELIQALENREADLTPDASITNDRKRYLNFTAGISRNPAGVVGLKDDDDFKINQHLIGKRVAVGEGHAAQDFLPHQFPMAVLVPVKSGVEALKQLQAGEVDYFYGDLSHMFHEPDKSLTANIEIKQRVFYSTGWNHIAVRSDWPLVPKMFDRFIIDGRSELDADSAALLGVKTTHTFAPLTLTIAENSFLSGRSSLKVGALQGMPLLNDVDERGQHIGIASEFTAFLASQLGLATEIFSYETPRELSNALNSGKIDIIPYAAITDPRDSEFLYSQSYTSMPWLIVGRIDDKLYWDLGSLRGQVIALREDHPLMPLLQETYPEITVISTIDAESAVRAVAKGKAAATIEPKLYVNRVLSQRYAGKLHVLGDVKEAPGHFGFEVSKLNPVLVPMINKALSSMPEDVADRVIRRWVAVDFQPEKRLQALLNILLPVLGALLLFLLGSIYRNRLISKESQQRLETEQRLVDMTENLRTGVFQFKQYRGQTPKMQFSNRVTREMARISPDDKYGQGMSFFEHIDPEDREQVETRLRHCLSTGEQFRESYRFNYPGGEQGWVLADAQCRQEKDGARVWSGYLFDLTSERLLSEELNEALLSRDEFISMASHELRTPVQNVHMALESVNKQSLEADQVAKFDTAMTAAMDLEELVNDIVELTAIRHNSSPISRESFNLYNVVNSVCETFIAPAEKKNLVYTIVIDDAVPQSVVGDALRIRQILYNIIGNAIKYTDSGTVSVTVGLGERTGDAAVNPIEIKVRDTGIGIAKNKLQAIFEPFATIGPASRHSSGLGLALSNRLVATMGGHIVVKSIEGQGSLFTISLPLIRDKTLDHEESADTERSHQRFWNEESDTLLVVDDDLLVRELTSTLLALQGWNVVQAESGEEAIGIIARKSFKAVISDQQMQGMNGVELAHHVLAASDGGHRPVLIMMTGGMQQQDFEQASRVFDAVLFKPIKAGQITHTITAVINQVRVSA